MEAKIESTELPLESEIEELESKVAPAGDDTVLPLSVHIRTH